MLKFPLPVMAPSCRDTREGIEQVLFLEPASDWAGL